VICAVKNIKLFLKRFPIIIFINVNLMNARSKIKVFWLSIKVIVNFYFHRNGKRHQLPAELIVSLTSYPARFSTLHLTLKCLLAQNVSPDKVILWIAHQDKELLPTSVTKLTLHGLEIGYTEDLRSYKKIIPTLGRYPNAYIVTADDDVYYESTWLEELVNESKATPHAAISHRVHTIVLGDDKLPLPYNDWIQNSHSSSLSGLTFQTGVGGVLYPPNIFHADVMKISLFKDICLHADDVWLYWMVRMAGGKIKGLENRFVVHNWKGSQNTALWKTNVLQNGNDAQILNMISHYGFNEL
jgi:protein O-GlcNAc transferase